MFKLSKHIPSSLRSKWEKKIVKYAEEHQNAYPGFHRFTTLIQSQATLQNHLNVVASSVTAPREPKGWREDRRKFILDSETNVYRTTFDDNQVSLSQDDRRFLKIIYSGDSRKNGHGNWEKHYHSV